MAEATSRMLEDLEGTIEDPDPTRQQFGLTPGDEGDKVHQRDRVDVAQAKSLMLEGMGTNSKIQI